MARWPWVSRLFLDHFDAERAASDLRYRDLMARYDALLTKYHALRMAGATTDVPLAVCEPKAPDPCVVAALAKARGNGRLVQHYLGVIAEMRAEHKTDAVIIAAINEGIPDDPAIVGIGD